MRPFLAEGYLSSATPSQLMAAGARVSQAARELAAAGQPVAYLHAVFLPSDQTWLALFEASAAGPVSEACLRAGIPCDRVTSAVLAGPPPASDPDGSRAGGAPSTGEAAPCKNE
jgi:hypothetical protein